MRNFFLILFVLFNSIANQTLFNHATKTYTDYLIDLSPENSQHAQTIINAAKIIQEVEQETSDNPGENQIAESDEKTFEELRLICKKGSPFLERANPRTAVGMAFLIKILTQPSTDVKELKKRQMIIKFFADNPDIASKITALLVSLKEQEASLLISYSNYTTAKAVKAVCLGSAMVGLEALTFIASFSSAWLDYLGSIISGEKFANFYLTHALRSRVFGFDERVSRLVLFVSKEVYRFFKAKTSFENLSPIIKNRYSLLIAGSCSIIPVTCLGKTLWWLFRLSKETWQTLLNNQFSLYCNEVVMTAFRIQNEISFFKIAKIGYEIQSEFPHPLRSLKDDEQLVQKAITFINHSKNTDFLIGTDGTITECVDGFYEQKNLSSLFFAHSDFFKKLYYDMGLLDAYIVLARMHKTYEHPFSHYSNHKSAFLKIVEGLHPNVLNEQTSIRNNFMHGDSIDKPIVVVSGKNGSGKSFNIKMIILNVWLAQTIGFTLTKEACILTPFDYFKIHANISDSDYYSKFQTEGTEIAQLIEKSANLEEKGKKCFILFDEPLSTTSAFFGEPILNALISILDNHKHSLLFIITHLHGILTNKTVRQMSIKVIQNADGTFTSTRKFQEGPSYDNDAPYFIANKLSPLISQEFLKAYHAAFEKK